MLRLIQRIKNLFHLFQAILANFFYGFPSRKLKIIGVTGTDGKTTTAFLIHHILKTAGKKTSMISTVKSVIGNKEYDIGLHTTTPSSFSIQGFLKKSVKHGDSYFVLETTSHALDQNRVWGINFAVSVLTNITHEHMDYHQDFEHYLLTKTKLFLNSDVSIINRDDDSYEKLKNILNKDNKAYFTYSLKNKADYDLNLAKALKTDLADFNNYNYLAAYSVSKLLGLSDKKILNAVKTFKLPIGRMDLVYNRAFKVYVDFANTANAIKNVLLSIREKYLKGSGRIIHVFGTPGRRDKEKRPMMGRESEKYADLIILTGDDYRDEDPKRICEEIASGFSKKDKLYDIIINRRKAIEKAIQLAKKDDVIILTGIGHQKALAQGKAEIPWDEGRVINEIIKELKI